MRRRLALAVADAVSRVEHAVEIRAPIPRPTPQRPFLRPLSTNRAKVCASPLAQVLVASSFRAASSQQPTAECTSAFTTFSGLGAQCGYNAASCASKLTACTSYAASMTEAKVQEMATAFASCTGDYARMTLYGADKLTTHMLDTFSRCGVTTSLSPPPLTTCHGAESKYKGITSECGYEGGYTCSASACIANAASATVTMVADMIAGLSTCTGGYAVYGSVTAESLTQSLLSTFNACGLTSALSSPPPPSPAIPPLPPLSPPPPSPVRLCQADVFDSRFTVDSLVGDRVCKRWLDAGHNCSTKWDEVCTTDHPNGADQNNRTLSTVACSQCLPPRPRAELRMGGAAVVTESNGLSGGAIAGIVIGSLVGAALLVGLAFLRIKKLQQSHPEDVKLKSVRGQV